MKNIRPTINSYMYGNAVALAKLARLAGRECLAGEFTNKAARLRRLVQEKLWNADAQFFEVRHPDGHFAEVREAIGFIPWYFHLPEPRNGYEVAWQQLTDEQGFWAPYGLTTAERRHPDFRSHGVGTCEWDGAVWPYATSQTLVALGNVLRDYPDVPLSRDIYFKAFATYTHAQRYDGLPYIGEYHDEVTGQWLKGRNPRSAYYHHSTYADLLIGGLVGLRCLENNRIEVDPLLPPDTWDWFCLDGVPYRGHQLTILWDKDGAHFGRGSGFQLLVDGKVVVQSDEFEKLEVTLP